MADSTNNSDSFWNTFKRVYEPSSKGNKLWENARFVLADVPLDARETKKILPLGMRLTQKPTATLFIVNYTKTSFTVPYMEAAVLIHVRTPLGQGLHCPWMLVDDDTALIYGRELLGYPKKRGAFTFEENDGLINAGVARRATEVLRFETRVGQAQASPAPVFDFKTFNVGGMGQWFIVQPVWMFRPKEIIHESYEAESTVTIGKSEYDPIYKLVAGAPFNSRMVVMDIPGGKYNLPVGLAGFRWFVYTYYLRYR